MLQFEKPKKPADIVTWWGGPEEFELRRETILEYGTQAQFHLVVEWDRICRILGDRQQADERIEEFKQGFPLYSDWFVQEYKRIFLAD